MGCFWGDRVVVGGMSINLVIVLNCCDELY
jgi:hypothetical protein